MQRHSCDKFSDAKHVVHVNIQLPDVVLSLYAAQVFFLLGNLMFLIGILTVCLVKVENTNIC